MEDLDELLTTPEYARERKCSKRTIERERTSGTGCKFVKFGRSVRYRRRDILDFIARHVRASTSDPAYSRSEDPARSGPARRCLGSDCQGANRLTPIKPDSATPASERRAQAPNP
jgi:hypothetical protein